MAADSGYRKEEYSGGEPPGREDKHSRMGITSFLLFVLSVLLLIGALIVSFAFLAPIFQEIDPQVLQDPQSLQNPQDLPPELREPLERATPLILLVAVGFLGAPFLSFVGLGFGIGGLIQKRRKRIFATLGTILNGLGLLAVVALLLLGLIGGAAGIPAG